MPYGTTTTVLNFKTPGLKATTYRMADDEHEFIDPGQYDVIDGPENPWGPVRISGDDGNDTIYGSWGEDRIWGGGGDDWIFGGDSTNDLYSGSGKDRIFGGDWFDNIFLQDGFDYVDGGAGRDTLYWDDAVWDVGVHIDLSRNAGYSGDAYGSRFFNIENIIGTHFEDTLIGDAEDNYLNGWEGRDEIRGGAGRDYIMGSTSKFSSGSGLAAGGSTLGWVRSRYFQVSLRP